MKSHRSWFGAAWPRANDFPKDCGHQTLDVNLQPEKAPDIAHSRRNVPKGFLWIWLDPQDKYKRLVEVGRPPVERSYHAQNAPPLFTEIVEPMGPFPFCDIRLIFVVGSAEIEPKSTPEAPVCRGFRIPPTNLLLGESVLIAHAIIGRFRVEASLQSLRIPLKGTAGGSTEPAGNHPPQSLRKRSDANREIVHDTEMAWPIVTRRQH